MFKKFNDYSIFKKLLFIFLIIFLIILLISLPELINYMGKYSFNEIKDSIIKYILKMNIASIIITCIFSLPLIVFNSADKKTISYNLDKNDFGKYKNYYRDIIKDYSPAILSYIDDYKLNSKDIISTILNLKLKKYIDIKDNKFIIVNNDYSKLENNEQYILNNINKNINIFIFQNIVLEEAINKGLIESKINKSKIIKNIIIYTIIIVLSMCLTFYLLSNNIGLIYFISLISLTIIFPIYELYIISIILSFIKNRYVRTKKGKEINEKLEGLKNYLKDFSNLDEKDVEEIKLWEDYLIYSVLFNQNTNIINEIGSILQNNC